MGTEICEHPQGRDFLQKKSLALRSRLNFMGTKALSDAISRPNPQLFRAASLRLIQEELPLLVDPERWSSSCLVAVSLMIMCFPFPNPTIVTPEARVDDDSDG